MKVLVFALAPLWSPHFETELELVARHRDQGDEVFVVTCQRSLTSCIANPYNRRIDCLACVSKCKKGLEAVQVSPESQVSMTSSVGEIGAFTPPSEEVTMGTLRELEVDGYNIGQGVASSLVSILRDSSPDLRLHRSLISRLITSAVEMIRVTETALEAQRPDVVYVFNGRFATARSVIEVCKRRSVPFRTHDSFYQTGQYSVVEGGTVHALSPMKRQIEDCWISGAEPARTELAREFFEHRRYGGDAAGPDHLRFNQAQETGKLPDGVSDLFIAMFNSSEDEFTSVDGYENPVYGDQIEALDAILDDRRLSNVQFVLRVHPNLEGLRNRQTRHLQTLSGRQNLIVVPATDSADTYALMDSAALVVTFGSTTGIEAVYWRRPSVLVGRAPYEDLGPRRVTNHEEVVSFILDPPPVADIEGALKYGYFMRRGGEVFDYYDQLDYHKGAVNGVDVRPGFVTASLRRARNAARIGLDSITPGTDQRKVSQR